MAKLNNPLLSLAAWGRIAANLAARRSTAGPVLQNTTFPHDARTSAQLAWRTMYQLAVSLWHALTPSEKQAWEAAARPNHMTGYNYFLAQALRPNPGVYLPLAGGTMAGTINMAAQRITNLPAPVDDAEPLRKGDTPASSIPAGIIVMWSGLLANIPAGWALCDGADGRPDLRSKFIKGTAAGINPGVEGGAATHSHSDHPALSHSGTAVDAHSAHAGAAVADHAAKDTGLPTTPTGFNTYGAKACADMDHIHQVSAYAHAVTQPNNHSNHAVTQPSSHAAQSHSNASNEPVFYSLAFIIKT